jgi:hypothetical protein
MIFRRSTTALVLCSALELVAGCSSQSSIKPAETLDERTGVTVASLEKPISLIQNAPFAATAERRVSFAYLGPVEWDNMGTISYGLWVHLAPANDWQFEDIRSQGAVRLALDGESGTLVVIDTPPLGGGPYHPVAPWGQTAYFALDPQLLKRMASSGRIELDFKADGADTVRFIAAPDAHESLMRYLRARNLAE